MSTTNAVHIRVHVHHQQHTQHRDTQHQHLWRHSPQQQHPQLLYNTHSKDIWSNNRHNSTESWCPWQDKSSRTSHSNTTRSIPTVQIELAANVPILYENWISKEFFHIHEVKRTWVESQLRLCWNCYCCGCCCHAEGCGEELCCIKCSCCECCNCGCSCISCCSWR